MSSGVTWTGATAGVLALTGIATGWYWLIGVALVAGIAGVILIRMSRRRSIARDDESGDFEAMVAEDAAEAEAERDAPARPSTDPDSTAPH